VNLRIFIASLAVVTTLAGCATGTANDAAPAAASVSFIEPADGAVVPSLFRLKFAVSGMQVAPAGKVAANTGHHHLLVNSRGSVPVGESVGFLNFEEIHYSRGQTETQLFLPPGPYRLTLQFANGAHESYGPAMSKTINITVK